MKIWIDAQLSPSLALWISELFGIEAIAVRDLGLRDATDLQIFEEGRKHAIVIMTKDSDFLNLVYEKGTPPQIIWITCGNTSNASLQRILKATLGEAIELLAQGEEIVEIRHQTLR